MRNESTSNQNFVANFILNLEKIVEIYMNFTINTEPQQETQTNSQEIFKAMFAALELTKCNEGSVENLERLTQFREGFSALLYKHKYLFFEELAKKFLKLYRLSRGTSYEIHDILSVLLVLAKDYKLQVQGFEGNPYVNFQGDDPSVLSIRDLIKHDFKLFLQDPTEMSNFLSNFYCDCHEFILGAFEKSSKYTSLTSPLNSSERNQNSLLTLEVGKGNKVFLLEIPKNLEDSSQGNQYPIDENKAVIAHNSLNLNPEFIADEPQSLERLLNSHLFNISLQSYCDDNFLYPPFVAESALFEKFEKKLPLLPKDFPNFIEHEKEKIIQQEQQRGMIPDENTKILFEKNLSEFVDNMTSESKNVSNIIAPCKYRHISRSSLSTALDFLIEYRLHKIGLLIDKGKEENTSSDWQFFLELYQHILYQKPLLETDVKLFKLFDICERRNLFEALIHIL